MEHDWIVKMEPNVTSLARDWIGTPFHHQASLKGIGCDCLGLVRGVWRDIYGFEPEAMPAYSRDWAEAGLEETLAKGGRRHLIEIIPELFDEGDVLLFRWKPHLPAKHCAIATSRKSMIHAQEGICVSEVALTKWWLSRLSYVFRFPEKII